ncbi:hypothetical protein [Kordia zhangzhouensis]|uniref:hypothetical protein n=1 Tax=Kordia zhangzhouensis TaxID=1620405 RepID=UPI00062958C2|nr:hypothetical protein [Kordia zhangzhouensis]
MGRATKDTIQRILLIALSAMTVSMILISIFNYNDNKQKNEYLEKEKVLVQEELTEIIKNYDHFGKVSTTKATQVQLEKEKVKALLKRIQASVLDYETIIDYRKQMIELRKSNRQMQQELNQGMSSGDMNTSY